MSETVDERFERGLRVAASMLGPNFADRLQESARAGGFGSSIARMAIESCFANSWTKEGLTDRERSLVMLGLLIGMRQDKELKNHVKIGTTNGLAAHEIEAVLILVAPYVGVPSISQAMTAVIEALRETGMDPGVTTSQEKGLL